MATLPVTPRKRSRDDEVLGDTEPTPKPVPPRPGGSDFDRLSYRPSDSPAFEIAPSTQASSTTTTTSHRSSTSRNSSPQKQLRAAELEDSGSGFVIQNFADNSQAMPKVLQQLVSDLVRVQIGHDIIPTTHQEELRPFIYPAGRVSPTAFYDPDKRRQEPSWRVPDLDWVKKTKERAHRCEGGHNAEAVWNAQVHDRVLRWVHEPDDELGLVRYLPCTSIKVHQNFKPSGYPSSKVDFCTVIGVTKQDPLRDSIDRRCRSRASKSINHVCNGDFYTCPIGLSIETKRIGDGWDKATLQMGTWHTAQWKSLRQMGAGRPHGRIEFLPGIIIQGHDWAFVATVWQNEHAVMFTKIAIGGTEDEFGIYKLVLALQILERWTRDVYWSAFKADILDVSVDS